MANTKQQDETTPSRVGKIRQSVTDSVAVALAGPRLQLAAKAGLAAGLAFLIAPLMPGAAAQPALSKRVIATVSSGTGTQTLRPDRAFDVTPRAASAVCSS